MAPWLAISVLRRFHVSLRAEEGVFLQIMNEIPEALASWCSEIETRRSEWLDSRSSMTETPR